MPFGFLDLRLLCGNLGVVVGDHGLGLVDLRLRAFDGRFVVSIIDPGEDVASFDDLIVRDRNFNDVAADFRTDRHGPTVDERVVRALEISRMKIVEHGRDDSRDKKDDADGDAQRMLANEASRTFDAAVALFLVRPAFCAGLARFFAALVG